MKTIVLLSAFLLGCVGTRDEQVLEKEEQEQYQREFQERDEKLEEREKDVIYRQTGS